MIRIGQPSMVLNAAPFSGRVTMWNTRDVDADTDALKLLLDVRKVALGAPSGRLRCLVINCHGIYSGTTRDDTGGYGLDIGRGIRRVDTGLFGLLRQPGPGRAPLVDDILIHACGVARISPLDNLGDGDGNLFCCEIAKASGAFVTAATTKQLSSRNQAMPFGCLDDWEGLVLKYGPLGNVVWSNDYGRGLIDALVHGVN